MESTTASSCDPHTAFKMPKIVFEHIIFYVTNVYVEPHARTPSSATAVFSCDHVSYAIWHLQAILLYLYHSALHNGHASFPTLSWLIPSSHVTCIAKASKGFPNRLPAFP